jgi:predicted transposase YdaD
MTQITTQSIVNALNSIEVMKAKLNLELMNKNMELRDTALYQEIKDLETSIKELSTQETQIKEQGKNLLLNAGLKKFEALN